MSAGTTIGFVLIGFVVYVFAKGELSKYVALFKKNATVSGSGEAPETSGLPSLSSIIGNLSGE